MSDWEYSDYYCPKCGEQLHERDCDCEDGYSYHDCGEDTCCCLDDSPNVKCDECGGTGIMRWCANKKCNVTDREIRKAIREEFLSA